MSQSTNRIPFAHLESFSQMQSDNLLTVIFADRRPFQDAQYHAFILADVDGLDLCNPRAVCDRSLVRTSGKNLNEVCTEAGALIVAQGR